MSMYIPTGQINKAGLNLSDIASKMQQLSNRASSINSSISRCYMQGGVGWRAGSAASQMGSLAIQARTKGQNLCTAASIYEKMETDLSARSCSVASTIQNGFNVFWADIGAVKSVLGFSFFVVTASVLTQSIQMLALDKSIEIENEKKAYIIEFEKANPEMATAMDKVLSDPDLTQQEREDIKYTAYSAKEPYRTLYFEHIKKYKVEVRKDSLFSKGSFYRPKEGKIYLTDSDETFADNPRGPYNTFFHESGHAIDDFEYGATGDESLSNNYCYNGKTLQDIMVEDTRTYVENEIFEKDPILSKLSLEQRKTVLKSLNLSDDADFYDYANKPTREDFIGVWKEFFSPPPDPWKLDDPVLESARLRAQELMYEDLKGNTNEAASDVYGGITNNAIHGNYGHTSEKYWYNENGATGAQARELWAEFYAAQMTQNDEALESIQRHFPKAYEAMENMAKEMSQTPTGMSR